LADIYGNAPNSALRGHPGYGLFLVVLILVFGIGLAVINRQNPKGANTEEADKKEAEEERLRDRRIKVTTNQNDKSSSED
jgi:hypothetical protein